jgi:hypothetical protein
MVNFFHIRNGNKGWDVFDTARLGAKLEVRCTTSRCHILQLFQLELNYMDIPFPRLLSFVSKDSFKELVELPSINTKDSNTRC